MRVTLPIVKMDFAFSLFCLQHRYNHQVARVSKSISHTGDGHLYAVIGLIAWLLDGETGRLFLIAGLMAFALELPIYWFAKNSLRRRRPQEFSSLLTSHITPSDRYSLPSGHTASAFIMASIMGHFYPESDSFALIWACLIGASRVLLGVHFLTDVLIGAALGLSCSVISLSLIGA